MTESHKKDETNQPVESNSNNDAVLGHILANAYLRPAKEFNAHFPETSAALQNGASKGVDLGKQGAKKLGKGALTVGEFLADKIAGRAATTALATVAAVTILGTRLIVGAWTTTVDWAIRPAQKKFVDTFPKTSANVKAGYDTYNKQFKKIGYPLSVPVFTGAAALIGYTTYEATKHLMEILTPDLYESVFPKAAAAHKDVGHHDLSFTQTAYQFVAPKAAKVALFKPLVITFKTSREGFFQSDLYNNKLQPTYETYVAPPVKKTRDILRKIDQTLENTPSPYKFMKKLLKKKEQGGFVEQGRAIAEQTEKVIAYVREHGSNALSKSFGRATTATRKVLKPVNKAADVNTTSKLDDTSSKAEFDIARKNKNDKGPSSPSTQSEPDKPAPDTLG